MCCSRFSALVRAATEEPWPCSKPLGTVGRFHVMAPTGVVGWDFVWAFSNHLSGTVGEDSWDIEKEKD